MGVGLDYSKIFLAYDIRGVYQKELDVKFAYKLGRAFVLFTNAKEVAVGYDGRTSSKKLFEHLSKGIMDQGATVIENGLVSTPGWYYSMIAGKYPAGIMITASHLPKQYNGFKLMGKSGNSIHLNNGMKEILDIILAGDFSNPTKKGGKRKKNWDKDYKKYLLENLQKTKYLVTELKNLKIVIDQSNGSGAIEVDALRTAMPKAKILNGRVSGTFPGHDPDPTHPGSRKKLCSEIKKFKADFGLMFDGDADRVVFLDEKGNTIRGDVILGIMMSDYKKGKVVYDTRASKGIPELAHKYGMQAFMSKSGRSYVIDAMRKEQAELGGENTGHYFFKEFKFLDCAGLAAIKVIIKYILENKKEDKVLSELASEHNLYHHSGEINFKVKNPSKAFLIVEQGFPDAQKTLFIDGLSVYYEDFWFNVRKSNTEAVVRVNAEANTKEGLDNIIGKLTKIMNLAK